MMHEWGKVCTWLVNVALCQCQQPQTTTIVVISLPAMCEHSTMSFLLHACYEQSILCSSVTCQSASLYYYMYYHDEFPL